MSKTENFLNESGEALQPVATEIFNAVVKGLNTLCGGSLSCGDVSVVAGTKGAAPEALSPPLVGAVCEAVGDVTGRFAIVVDVKTAQVMTALMLGGAPPADGAEILKPDEMEAFRKLGANAASSAGSSLCSTLSCEASTSVKSTETMEDVDGLNELLGGEHLFISAEGTIADRQVVILMACETEMCRAALAAAPSPQGPPEPEKGKEAPDENLKRILKIPVPVIVVLAEKVLTFKEVLDMSEGMVLEFNKNSEESLQLLVNDRKVGVGRVVKAGERFGLKIEEIGDAQEIVKKL